MAGSNQTYLRGADGSYEFIGLAPQGISNFRFKRELSCRKQNQSLLIADQTANLDFALAPVSLTITPANQNVTNVAGTTQFTIAANVSWAATVDQPWCSHRQLERER